MLIFLFPLRNGGIGLFTRWVVIWVCIGCPTQLLFQSVKTIIIFINANEFFIGVALLITFF